MSPKIEFVDQTIRDGQISLWAYLMSTDMIVPIAEMMDRVGFKAITTIGSQGFTVQMRNLNEDPWERIRILAKLIKKTPIRGSYQIGSLSSFDLSTPRDVIALWIKRSVANGIKSFWICDYQEDMEKFVYFARMAKAEGAEIVTALMYTSSPVHTSEHWARKARLIAEKKDFIDRIWLEDTAGVITPEGTRDLIPTVLKNCGGIPVEFHVHCNSGLAPLCYIEAMKMGITTLHTAVAPLANGASLPATEAILRNAKRLGFQSDLDEDALVAVSAHFRKIAEKEGLPIGTPAEFDLFHFEHQVPGGMISNFKRQLRELGMEHLLDKILEEVVLVRKEFGYPVMATPYSQIVGTQAVENVVSGERYGRVTDEAIKYVLGYFGKPVVPIDQNVMDKIMSLPRTKQYINWVPEGYLKSVEELRREFDPGLSDDEFLLRFLVPGKTLRPGGPAKRGSRMAAKSTSTRGPAPDTTNAFRVEVDGEIFTVRILPMGDEGSDGLEVEKPDGGLDPRKVIPPGGIVSVRAGLILSVKVNVGQKVREGDVLLALEAMKMKSEVQSEHDGVVTQIHVQDGDTVNSGDLLAVVEPES